MRLKSLFLGVILFGYSFQTSSADAVSDFLDSGEFYAGRSAQQLAQFPEVLSAGQLQACLQYLNLVHDGVNYRSEIVRQNDLADWLLQKDEYAAATTLTLIEVINDPSHLLVWREYALQKLASAYAQEAVALPIKEQIIETLFKYVGNKEASFSGTALLGLLRIRVDSEGLLEQSFPENELFDAAKRVLDQNEFSTLNKVTALQVAAHLDLSDVLLQARSYVFDEELDLQLRASAIATLSRAPTEADLEYLATLKMHPDYRIRHAVRSALMKFN